MTIVLIKWESGDDTSEEATQNPKMDETRIFWQEVASMVVIKKKVKLKEESSDLNAHT